MPEKDVRLTGRTYACRFDWAFGIIWNLRHRSFYGGKAPVVTHDAVLRGQERKLRKSGDG